MFFCCVVGEVRIYYANFVVRSDRWTDACVQHLSKFLLLLELGLLLVAAWRRGEGRTRRPDWGNCFNQRHSVRREAMGRLATVQHEAKIWASSSDKLEEQTTSVVEQKFGKKMNTTPGIPTWSPTVVLTRPEHA